MTPRAARSAELAGVARLLARSISERERSAEWDPILLERIVRRTYGADVRFVLGLFAAVGRPVSGTIVGISRGGHLAGALVWARRRRAMWVAALAGEPGDESRSAQLALLGAAWELARARGLRTLVVPGPSLAGIEADPAALASIGFRPVAEHRRWVLDRVGARWAGPKERHVRPFRARDVRALGASLRTATPPALESIAPAGPEGLAVSSVLARLFGSSTAAFVHDGAGGPDAFARVTVNRASRAGHLALVVDPSASAEAARGVIAEAGRWACGGGADRILSEAPEGAGPVALGLRSAEFVPTESWTTWARTVDGGG